VNCVANETTEATGISKTLVFKVCSESLRGTLVNQSKTRQNKVRKKRREVKYDDFFRNPMRRKLYFQNKQPTLNGIMTANNKEGS
jgi:hypothetical protein